MKTTTILAAAAALALAGASAGRAEDGATVYTKRCATCHGKTGAADTKAAEAMGIAPFGESGVGGTSVADLRTALQASKAHATVRKGMSDEQIDAALGHVTVLAGK